MDARIRGWIVQQVVDMYNSFPTARAGFLELLRQPAGMLKYIEERIFDWGVAAVRHIPRVRFEPTNLGAEASELLAALRERFASELAQPSRSCQHM